MALSEQERRYVDIACWHLGVSSGGVWGIFEGSTLDDSHSTEPTSEVIVTDGTRTAAVKVKRLTHAAFQEYSESWESLRRRLAPECGGHYLLMPCLDFRMPISLTMMRISRREIARVAPTLRPGEQGAIRIHRSSHVSLLREDGPSAMSCCHNATGQIVRDVSTRITGIFILVDCDTWEHPFVTDHGREAFCQALAEACRARVRSGAGPLEWDEEWKLIRYEDEKGEARPSSVEVLAVSDVIDVRLSVTDTVARMIEKARQKFAARRWADVNMLVLDRNSGLIGAEAVRVAISAFDASELQDFDSILFTDGDDAVCVWPL